MLRFQIDQYLQQLQGLEILASRVQTSGQPADYIELERKMREAEELLQRILRDTEILQGKLMSSQIPLWSEERTDVTEKRSELIHPNYILHKNNNNEFNFSFEIY